MGRMGLEPVARCLQKNRTVSTSYVAIHHMSIASIYVRDFLVSMSLRAKSSTGVQGCPCQNGFQTFSTTLISTQDEGVFRRFLPADMPLKPSYRDTGQVTESEDAAVI
jgi:hypothetical protein